ncbi:hypothetical protein AB7C87_13560 [Natrarchaeobius sp. A-rgal3]|uniref:hypothetical protein n=1 Tax=Natrarchaeobius versutus TaxID=1679078 RepID=UPI00350FA77A
MLEVAWFLLIPVGIVVGVVTALFLHELAHAVPILLAGGTTHITIGSDSGRTVGFGPLTMTVGFDGVWKLMLYGRCRSERHHSSPVRAISVLAGPVVTVVIVSTLWMVSRGVSGPLSFVLTAIFYSELFRAILTTVPMTYPTGPYAGMTSDGKRFLEIVRS